MAMQFRFSVGDIIAGIGVIKTAVGALSSTGGATIEYRSLLTSLDILSDCFADIEETYADQTGDDRRYPAIFREIGRCKLCIDRFHQRFTKYEVLKANEPAIVWRQQLRRSMKKVQWAVFDKGEIERFNQELHERIDSVKFLLLSFQGHRAEIERKAQQTYRERMLGTEQLLSEISISNQDYFEQQKIWIDRIKTSQDVLLQTSGSQAVQTQDMLRMLQKMHQQLSNSCLSLEHEELHRQRDREYARHFEMLLEKIQIQATVPPQVLFRVPVTFLDALGKLSPVQLDFITSAEAFIAVIKIRFRNIGLKKIEQEEYLLLDPHRKRKLDLKLPWETVMIPGQRVEMSMIFSKEEEMQTTCPTCRKENVEPKGSEMACDRCGQVYQRAFTSSKASIDLAREGIVSTQRGRIVDYAESDLLGTRISDFRRVCIIYFQKTDCGREVNSDTWGNTCSDCRHVKCGFCETGVYVYDIPSDLRLRDNWWICCGRY